MPYVYTRKSAGFWCDEIQSHSVDCFLVTCGAKLLGI